MIELINKRGWDKKVFDTGKQEEGKTVFGTKLQNGLHDIEPDGSFMECDTGISEITQGVTHLKMNRGRMGELRFGDSSHPNSFLVKIKNKALKGVSFKYTGANGSSMTANNGKPLCNFDNGISIESTPYYKGVKMDILVNAPLTAPLEYPFSVKTYGQDYVFIEDVNGGATLRGEDQAPIFIKPPYAIDANGDIGSVTIYYTGIVNNLITFKKVVDETWFRQAAAPVRIDPDVTIEDGVDGGVIEDVALASSGQSGLNYGGAAFLNCQRLPGGDTTNTLIYVDLSAYTDITVINSKFGLDFYTVLGINLFDYHKVLVDWVEGTANGAPQDGSSCWDYRITSTDNWDASGCEGSGIDYLALKDGSITISGIDSDKAMPLSNALTQDWIDNASNNRGILWIKTTTENPYSVARSSETALGNQPYFYMEYTEGDGGSIFFFNRGEYDD